MSFRVVLIFILTFFLQDNFAQLKPFKSNKSLPFVYRENAKFNLKYIDVQHGLSSSFIRSISEDSVGNLIMGTWGGGLMKYDGVTIDIYTTNSGLPDNIIGPITNFGDHHRIYFYDKGLYKLKGNQITPLIVSNDSINVSGQFKVRDESWVMINDSVLCLLQNDGKLKDLNKKYKLPYGSVYQITENEETLWIATESGLYSLEDNSKLKEWQAELGIMKEPVSRFLFAGDSLLYYTKEGMFSSKFDGSRKPFLFKGEVIEKVTILKSDLYNNIWIGTTGSGAYRWNRKEFIHLDINNGLTNNEVWCIYFDKFGNVWIGPRAGGLCRFDGDFIKHFDVSDGVSGKVVWALTQNPVTGIYYFGTIGGGVCSYNGEEFANVSFNEKLPHKSVRSLFCDARQNLWIGTIDGLAVYTSGGKLKDYASEVLIQKSVVYKITEDKEGTIWINHGMGLTCFKGGKFFNPYNQYPQINEHTYSTYFTKNGETWIGHLKGALALDKSGKQLYKNFTDSITSIGFCVVEDTEGRIWVGTRKGIYIWAKGKYFHITEKEGLSSDIVWSLGQDKNGAMWAGTEFGLTKIVFSKDKYTCECVGALQGFTGGDCTQNGLLIDKNGLFWWGTSNKLTCVNPYLTNKISKAPVLQLRSIALNYKPTDFIISGKRTFECFENHLTFQVSAIDWGNETNLKYKFMLDGFDTQWLSPTTEDKVTYSNLNPGKYVLKVIAISNTGLESDTLNFAFNIEPAFWQTLWFKILIAITILAAFFAFYKYRTYSLVQKKKLLESIIKKRTEEIVQQKELVEEKNKEILDSINYAKRLQDAILPPIKLVKSYLPQSLIVYKPKDIVAGDFYWFEKRGDVLLFAAADCTGHGVPGAMVSVVCSNALNRAVKEFGITEPAKILAKVRDLVLETFEKSESEVKDGMDISICAFYKDSMKLQWAGANNPLWLLRTVNEIVELIEIKPDKQPIGKAELLKPFTNHEIQLLSGDVCYVFTDGYADQFGGDTGKKYKSANFKRFLQTIQHLSMQEQEVAIINNFNSWRGNIDQIDDVCVIGIKV